MYTLQRSLSSTAGAMGRSTNQQQSNAKHVSGPQSTQICYWRTGNKAMQALSYHTTSCNVDHCNTHLCNVYSCNVLSSPVLSTRYIYPHIPPLFFTPLTYIWYHGSWLPWWSLPNYRTAVSALRSRARAEDKGSKCHQRSVDAPGCGRCFRWRYSQRVVSMHAE